MKSIDTIIYEIKGEIESVQIQIDALPKGALQRIREYVYLSYRYKGKPVKEYVGKNDSAEASKVAEKLEEKKVLLMKLKVLQDRLKKYKKAFDIINSMNTYEKLLKTPIVCDDLKNYGNFILIENKLHILSGTTGNVIPFEIEFVPEYFDYYLASAGNLLETTDAMYLQRNNKNSNSLTKDN